MKVEERAAAAGAHTPLDSWSLFAAPVTLAGCGEPSSSPADGIPWDWSSQLDLQSPGAVSADLKLRLAAGLSWEARF